MLSSRVIVRWAQANPGEENGVLGMYCDPVERERIDAAVTSEERAHLMASFALVRCTLAETMKAEPSEIVLDRTCAVCGAGHGKPRVQGSKIDVSVSHAGPWVVVALGEDYRVGVDSELGNDHRWTAIEAVTKCDGVGLRADYTGIEFSSDSMRLVRYPSRPALVNRIRLFTLKHVPLGVVATLAVDSREASITVMENQPITC